MLRNPLFEWKVALFVRKQVENAWFVVFRKVKKMQGLFGRFRSFFSRYCKSDALQIIYTITKIYANPLPWRCVRGQGRRLGRTGQCGGTYRRLDLLQTFPSSFHWNIQTDMWNNRTKISCYIESYKDYLPTSIILNSVRRLAARPSSVLLSAMGWLLP